MYQLSNENLILLLVTILWVLPWKAYALWTAVQRREKGWFAALIILNTFGILEIFYVFYIAKKKWSDIERVLHGILSKRK